MKKSIQILMFICPLSLLGQCDFVPFYTNRDMESSRAEIDSVKINNYWPSRFVFVPSNARPDEYDLFDMSDNFSRYGAIAVGLTPRGSLFIEVGWTSNNIDCILRYVVKYLNDEKNIHRKSILWDFDKK